MIDLGKTQKVLEDAHNNLVKSRAAFEKAQVALSTAEEVYVQARVAMNRDVKLLNDAVAIAPLGI